MTIRAQGRTAVHHKRGTAVRAADDGSQTEASPLSCSGSVTGSISASVDFAPSLDLEVQWGGIFNPGTITAQAYMQGTETAQISASVDAKASCSLDVDFPPQPITLGEIDVQIGPIPLIIVPELDFELKADADVEGELDSSATQEATAKVGVAWDGNNLTRIASLTNSFTFVPPAPTFNGSVHAQDLDRTSRLTSTEWAALTSARMLLRLFAVTIPNTPWWTLKGGIEAGGGLKFSVFGIDFDQGDDSILAQSGISQSLIPLHHWRSQPPVSTRASRISSTQRRCKPGEVRGLISGR